MNTVDSLNPPSAAAPPDAPRATVDLPKQPAEGGPPGPCRIKDLAGRRFGMLTALSWEKTNGRGLQLWNCVCDCGNARTILAPNLLSGNTKSCGCLVGVRAREIRRAKLVGCRFGRLLVLADAGNDSWGQSLWQCACDCGTTTTVARAHLMSGNTRSCGCLARELSSTRRKRNLINQRFGRLRAISLAGATHRGEQLWRCKCDCGRWTIVPTARLQAGVTTSCGCYMPESVSARRRARLANKVFGRLTVLRSLGATRGQTQLWECRCSCGRTTKVRSGDLISGNTRSCGCLAKDTTRARCFNPQRTVEDRERNRQMPDGAAIMPRLAKSTFSRDNYTCTSCGAQGGRLAAHHIFPWAEHSELRHDMANLVTLCAECHKQFHSIYGNDCDLDDLEEYLTD